MKIGHTRARRSVFDMITNIEHDNIDKPMKYRYLKSIFVSSKQEDKERMSRNLTFKEGVKNHLKEQNNQRKMKVKHKNREQKTVLVNLNFLTKL